MSSYSEFHLPTSDCLPMMAKKRSLLPFQPNYVSQHRSDNWNPSVWNWDSSRFVAKQVESDRPAVPIRTSHMGEDDKSLRLMLGGTRSLTSVVEAEPLSRPSKRVRSGSPGGANYPVCQVDDCKEHLSNAKDYHRRHKVCEVHSKATKALVAKQMQRFCQQCSRFHSLPEFDEGKRSCKRRLAGHNRRRRKTQPEDTTASQVLLPGNRENTGKGGDLDIVNLLAVLARSQGSTDNGMTKVSAVPDKEQLMQILSKLNSSPLPANLIEKLPILGSLNKNVSNNVPSQQAQSPQNGNTSSPSTMDLLTMLSATPATNANEVQSQRCDPEKSRSASMDQIQFTRLNLHNGLAPGFSFAGERRSSSNQFPVQKSDCHVQELHPNLPLQLFSSSAEIDSIPKLAADKKYFSSGSSNPSVDNRSPSSSPAVAPKFFPVPTSREIQKPVATRATDCIMPLQLFGAENGSSQSSIYQAGYTSSSGSDHSPSSLNSDAQDRTGRIIFKLFDKDPSHLPGTLRAQIYNWLANSPSEMESYIRPGCIVLSVYVSMSSSAWDQLEKNLYLRVRSLGKDILYSDFWRNARFLIQTHKQLASHKDGKVRVCKSWRVWGAPELISVSPVAVVFGQETTLSLRGRNLTLPGTKISCTHTAGYTVDQVPVPAYQQTTYDEISLGSFRINGADSTRLGRCFIEVENGVRGTSFPVIIASSAICQELRLLESEIRGGTKMNDSITADHIQESSLPSSKEETLHFLNELGWLFQRKLNSYEPEPSYYKLGRFKFLLIFSIERDLCALVKTLLDILLEMNIASEELTTESLEMLSEIHLLKRAVKRRCTNMVNLLLHYFVVDSSSDSDTSKHYFFPPNLVGPGGITPLHLAASMTNSDDLVDALTSDPQEIGLHCWNSLLDSNGMSPYAYASMRNSHSYNNLVSQKLADKENGQISVSIENGIQSLELEKDENDRETSVKHKAQGSCSKCTMAAAKYGRRMVKVPGSQGLLQRSYIHSVLAIAAVCVCVCLLLRGAPDIGSIAPFMWETLDFGPV